MQNPPPSAFATDVDELEAGSKIAVSVAFIKNRLSDAQESLLAAEGEIGRLFHEGGIESIASASLSNPDRICPKTVYMRNHGKIKLGFYPLPVAEARRLKNCLLFREQFSAVDPCIGDGVAFSKLLEGVSAHRYGIEIDAHRAEQAKGLGISTVQANALDVRCPAESISLLYLNPPYDFEAGASGNQRLEKVFLEHTYRWLKPAGVLVFVIPQPQLQPCARLLAEHFTNLRVYRLTDPACLQYKQIAVLAVRRKRNERTSDCGAA